MLGWCRASLEAALVGLEHDGVRLCSLKELTGEALLCTRKGNKRAAVYDLKLVLEWTAAAAGADAGAGDDAGAPSAVKGELRVAEWASANDEDEVTVTATVEGKGGAQEGARRRAAALRGRVLAALLRVAADMLSA